VKRNNIEHMEHRGWDDNIKIEFKVTGWGGASAEFIWIAV